MEEAPRNVKGRDIIFLCNGGIGDQLNQLPVIQYCRKNYLSEDTLSIVSDYEWIWEDSVDYVYTTKKPCPAMETSRIVELYPVNKPSSVDYQASHHTTFTSINLIRREIPLKDRQPKITLKEEYFDKLPTDIDYDNLFLFHPALTWTSRTLPREVWQRWINIVRDLGFKVALIGKNMQVACAYNEQFNASKGAYSDLDADYNFIDQLEAKETMALISKAKAIVTADGGPLHMAMCFNNFVFAFCSTRIPEYLFQWRGEEYSQYYKAAHLETDELFYHEYGFDPFIQTGTDTAYGSEEMLARITPTDEQFRKVILETLEKYK